MVSDRFDLEPAQEAALDRLSKDAKVVAAYREGPVIRRPDGVIVRVTRDGRIVKCAQTLVEDLQHRVIDMLLPKRLPASG